MAPEMLGDPLYDTFFRPTTAVREAPRELTREVPSVAHAVPGAPARSRGTRSRAGNAMNRTRAALLDGARQAVATNGTKITMAQVAACGGVAKATLYNHFRTREAVLAALVADEVQTLISRHVQAPLADALAGAAGAIATHPLLRALAEREPAALAGLGRIDLSTSGWQQAQAGVERALAGAGRAGAETVLRWLASYLLSPASPAEIAADLAILIAGLPDRASAWVTGCAIQAKTA